MAPLVVESSRDSNQAITRAAGERSIGRNATVLGVHGVYELDRGRQRVVHFVGLLVGQLEVDGCSCHH
jgi:hypothetical protein